MVHHNTDYREPPDASGMADTAWTPRRRRSLQVLAATYALVGGSAATALLFAGLSFGAFAIGLAITFALDVLTGRRLHTSSGLVIVIAYSFVFALLAWPVLLVAAGGLWGTWQ
jgi:hypothetical protein